MLKKNSILRQPKKLCPICRWRTYKETWEPKGLTPEPVIQVSVYWSEDTLLWQLSIDHNMNVQYQVAGSDIC